MKISHELRIGAFIATILTLPLIAWFADKDFFGGLALVFVICLVSSLVALIPAIIVSAISKSQNFIFAWIGAFIGGWSGFFASMIAMEMVSHGNPIHDMIFPFAFFTGFIGGTLFGDKFRGFPKKEDKETDSDLGYVLGEDAILRGDGLKTLA